MHWNSAMRPAFRSEFWNYSDVDNGKSRALLLPISSQELLLNVLLKKPRRLEPSNISGLHEKLENPIYIRKTELIPSSARRRQPGAAQLRPPVPINSRHMENMVDQNLDHMKPRRGRNYHLN